MLRLLPPLSWVFVVLLFIASDLIAIEKSETENIAANNIEKQQGLEQNPIHNNSQSSIKLRLEAHKYYLSAEKHLNSNVEIKSFSLAIIDYRKARDLGHAKAKNKLSSLESYLPNEFSLQSRYRQALRLAKEGDADAQLELAQMCEFGLGVKANMKRALTWYKRAAAQNSGYAQYRLGQLYDSGKIEQTHDVTDEQRLQWVRSAAENGEAEAQFKLAEHYLKISSNDGEPLPGDNLELAFDWYKKSAESGHTKSQAQVGKMLKLGLGVQQNYEKALIWFEKALNQGYEPAKQDMKEINLILDDLFLESLE